MDEILEVEKREEKPDSLTVVIVKKGDRFAGLIIDNLMGQQEIVIKSLGKYIENNKVDFVIYRGRDYRLLEELHSKGITTFNNVLTNKTANDKYLTYEFLKENNLPYIETCLDFSKIKSFPCIMKSVLAKKYYTYITCYLFYRTPTNPLCQ